MLQNIYIHFAWRLTYTHARTQTHIQTSDPTCWFTGSRLAIWQPIVWLSRPRIPPPAFRSCCCCWWQHGRKEFSSHLEHKVTFFYDANRPRKMVPSPAASRICCRPPVVVAISLLPLSGLDKIFIRASASQSFWWHFPASTFISMFCRKIWWVIIFVGS